MLPTAKGHSRTFFYNELKRNKIPVVGERIRLHLDSDSIDWLSCVGKGSEYYVTKVNIEMVARTTLEQPYFFTYQIEIELWNGQHTTINLEAVKGGKELHFMFILPFTQRDNDSTR